MDRHSGRVYLIGTKYLLIDLSPSKSKSKRERSVCLLYKYTLSDRPTYTMIRNIVKVCKICMWVYAVNTKGQTKGYYKRVKLRTYRTKFEAKILVLIRSSSSSSYLSLSMASFRDRVQASLPNPSPLPSFPRARLSGDDADDDEGNRRIM